MFHNFFRKKCVKKIFNQFFKTVCIFYRRSTIKLKCQLANENKWNWKLCNIKLYWLTVDVWFENELKKK